MFGPAALPMLRANTDTSNLLHQLVQWEQYGIVLGEAVPTEWSSAMLVPALQHPVIRGVDAERNGSKSVLHIFLFLKQGGRCHTVIGENSHWARSMALTSAVRRELRFLVAHHSARFHQATHSALKKVLFNHTTYAQVYQHSQVHVQ